MAWQSWDNVIDYVKTELGAPIINIELTDDQILEVLKKHTLPLFSKYEPLMRYYLMEEEVNCIQHEPIYIYQFKNFDYDIIRIDDIYSKPSFMDLNQNFNVAMYNGDITNLLMSNVMAQSRLTVMAQDTIRFMPPDKIEMIRATNNSGINRDFIVKVAVVHKTPSTIDPDLYTYFQQLSLAKIKKMLGSIRSKFENFSTPVGNVQLQSTALKQEGEYLEKEVIEILNRTAPDHYIYFLDDTMQN